MGLTECRTTRSVTPATVLSRTSQRIDGFDQLWFLRNEQALYVAALFPRWVVENVFANHLLRPSGWVIETDVVKRNVAAGFDERLAFRNSDSVRYEGPAQVLCLGLMRAISSLER